MPLASGSSRAVVSGNIRELMHSFDRKGAIGNSKPKSRKAAQRQAVAIALSQKRKTLASGR